MTTETAMSPTSTDRIERIVTFAAPQSRVWQAIADSDQFGSWFGMNLDAPFVPGEEVEGRMSNPKYSHLSVSLWVEEVKPEHYFSFRWHPYAIQPDVDYSAEPTTLVSFTLEGEGDETRVTIVESGFDAIPEARRAEAFRMNEGGWKAQAENLRKYVES